MARYIDVETALKIIDNYAKTVTADGIVVVKAIRDIVEIITPTADVVPKSDVEKWYHEYHAIKDELKQEKMYHKETEKLVDKYCTELEKSKAEIERLTINMNVYGLAVKRLAEERTEIFAEIYDRLLQSFPAQSFIDAPCTTHDRLFNMVAELNKKYTEGEQ